MSPLVISMLLAAIAQATTTASGGSLTFNGDPLTFNGDALTHGA